MKILIIAGARPNFMKVAPLIKAADQYKSEVKGVELRFDWRLVHTGQHYDQKMSEVFFQQLGIPAPHVNLEVGSGSHALQTANIMIRFENVVLQEKPDWVIVVGDVNSTLACTLVATKLGVKVAHVEAGLRSYDRTMPEEINRIVTDSLADLLLTPSEDANENLKKEGVNESKICMVGNIMIDSLVDNLAKARQSKTLERLGLTEKRFAYVTLHRPSNVDHKDNLTGIMERLTRLSLKLPVVFPIHPRTWKMISTYGVSVQRFDDLKIVEPLGYHDSLCLTENARMVITDSGGLQEESTYFQTPCLTLRANTERPVTILMGSNKLTSVHSLEKDIEHVLSTVPRKGRIPPLWDGKTAARILEALSQA